MLIPARPARGLFALSGTPRLDRSHPMAQGLKFLWVSMGGPNVDIVRGVRGSNPANAVLGSSYGPVTSFGSTDATKISFGTYIALLSGNGVGTGEVTVAAFANPSASGSQTGNLFCQRDSGGLASVNIICNENASGASASGSIALNGFAAGAFGASAPSAIDGNYHAFVGRRAVGNTCTMWVDGVDKTSSQVNSPQVIFSGTPQVTVGGLGGGTNNNFAANCNIMTVAAWDRGLSDAEISAWSRDPTCMLIYPDDDLFAELVGAVVVVGTAGLRFNSSLSGLGSSGPFFHDRLAS